MKKYTLTTADKLQIGDTFVKPEDPLEIIYTVLNMNCKKSRIFVKKGNNMMPDIIHKKKQVIFLNHTQ